MLSPEQFLEQLLEVASMNEKAISVLTKDGARRGFLPLNFRSYIRSISSYCLRTTSDLATYAEALEQFNVLEIFEELLRFHESKEKPSVFAHYSADDVDIVAVPIALGRFGLATSYISNVLTPAKSTPFWVSYVKGLNEIKKACDLSFAGTKLEGIQRHWVLYLQLLEKICRGDNTSDIELEIERSFHRCNSDSRLVNVGHIDPSGNFPVRWDLRFSYISTFAMYET